MPVTTDPNESTRIPELEELERREDALERRTASLPGVTVLALLFGFFAFGAAIVALTFALIDRADRNNRIAPTQTPVGSTAAPAAAGMGPGMMGGAGAPTGAAARVVNVRLGEMWVRPDRATVPAGKITFKARNVGMLKHELMVERAPIKMDGPGRPNEDAAQGMIEDMDHMQSGKMTLRLRPGRYVLFCNVPGHYAAGQHTALTVTRS